MSPRRPLTLVPRDLLAAQRSDGRDTVMAVGHKHAAFTCVRCTSIVSGAAPFCDFHLWTFDNPMLRDAPIFQA